MIPVWLNFKVYSEMDTTLPKSTSTKSTASVNSIDPCSFEILKSYTALSSC